MDKFVIRTKREKPQNECQNGDGRIGELSRKKARIDTKRLCEGEVIISDPALRKSIDDYEFESRNDVRRKYVLIGPCQPISHNFPRTQFGSANRCFQIVWFMKWEWLEYSVSQDSAFCLWCYLFGDKKFVNEAFIKRGFRNWKKATEKFKEHVGTKGSAHSKAQKLYVAFKEKQSLSKNLPSRKEIVISVALITAIAERKEAINGAAIVAAAEENPFVSNFFDNLSLIINTIGASCQRKDDLLQKQHEDMVERLEHDDVHSGRVLNQESGFGQLGDTRWGSHHKTIIRLLSMWSTVVEVLMNIYDDGSERKSRGKVVGLIDKMESYEFVFIAHFIKLVLGLIDSLSQFLQKKDQNEAVSLISILKRQLQDFRENEWDELLEDVSDFCAEHNIAIPNMEDNVPGRIRCRSNGHPITYFQHFRVEICCQVVDQIVQKMENLCL